MFEGWRRRLVEGMGGVGLLCACWALPACAGLGPQNVLVVVNDQSLESLEIGQYYQDRRGIPARNICHISVPPCVQGFPASYSITSNNWVNQIETPIFDHISANGLTNQIDAVVFSRDIPYKVNGNNGTTSAMFYRYKPVIAQPVSPNTTNLYYMSERGFSRRESTNDYYLSMMLTGWTLADSKATVDSGVASDHTAPAATAYLLKSADVLRNIRYHGFHNVEFLFRSLEANLAVSSLVAGYISGKTDVMGYLASKAVIYNLPSNTFLPGAMGDHMTSYGGRLFDSTQMSILDFIAAGACASYGTVVEPYSIASKFPAAMSYFWYARGFSLAESYWMSVQTPYNGLFVGEPLAAPYATPPSVTVTNLATNQVVSGIVTVAVAAVATAPHEPVSTVDLYVDDLFAAVLTNIVPREGNELSVLVDGSNVGYTVAADDTLYDVAAGLAANITAAQYVPVDASAAGDRVMLSYTNFGYYGSGVTYSVTAGTGTASELTICATNLTGNLLESEYPARELVQCLESDPNDGDWMRLIITLANGTTATHTVTADAASTVASMMRALTNAVNSDVKLQGSNGVMARDFRSLTSFTEFWLEARTNGPEGYKIYVDYDIERTPPPHSGIDTSGAFEDNMNDNGGDLTARGNILVGCGSTNLTLSHAWDTTAWPDGPHTLRVVAREGTSPRTQGHYLLPLVVSNSPLRCALSTPTNGQVFAMGSDVVCTGTVAGALGTVTQTVFYAEGQEVTVDTAEPFACGWGTLSNGPGVATLHMQAWDDAGSVAVSPAVSVTVAEYWDADGDDTVDEWERIYYGSVYETAGTNNPDADAFDDSAESIADTNPTNDQSFFQVLAFGRDTNTADVAVTFVASPDRLYTIEYNDASLTGSNVWSAVSEPKFFGTNTQHTWVDDGSTNRPHPSGTSNRFYRIKVEAP